MSYSCERTRTKAYNDDVRWRIVWQAMGLNFSVSKIAANLCVDESTVHRIINKFQETGEVQKKIYPLDKAYRKLTEPAQLFILQLVVRTCCLPELTVSAICKFLHKFTKQKAKMQSRGMKHCALTGCLIVQLLVFMMKLEQIACIRRRGYSLRGRTPIAKTFG